MGLSDLSDPDAVRAAIREVDELGRDAFLDKYGFGRSTRYVVAYDGEDYDVKGIAAAAHGFQFPDQGPLRPDKSYTSGLDTTVRKLESLGFEVKDLASDQGGGTTAALDWQPLI